MNLPSLVKCTMRALLGLPSIMPWPSPTKMLSSGAITTLDGALNRSWLSLSPATPSLPSVIRSFPSGLNFLTVLPLPFLFWKSVTQTFPERSANRPCGPANIPAPQFALSLPVASKWKIGGRVESPHNVCFSQRSKAHMLLPSLRSTEMPNVAPQLRPDGSFAQPSSSRHGLGAALGSGLVCADDGVDQTTIVAITAAASTPPIRFSCCMTLLPFVMQFVGWVEPLRNPSSIFPLTQALMGIASLNPSYGQFFTYFISRLGPPSAP